MASKVVRRTVDLSAFPDLVVIYLGMRVNALAGLKTLFGFGPEIAKSVEARPEGLLLHENLLYSLYPLHTGMRQYWRDFDAPAAVGPPEPHRLWWQRFLRDSGEPASGTRPTSCAVAWRPSMTTWSWTPAS